MSGSSSYRISIASSNSSIVCGSVAGIFDISVTISSNSVLRLRAVAHGLTGGSPMLELSVMCGVAGCFVLLWVPASAGMTRECAGIPRGRYASGLFHPHPGPLPSRECAGMTGDA